MAALQDQAGKPRPRRAKAFAYADDRRRFGTVGDAIVDVLAEAGGPMRLREIQEAVAGKLDGRVSINTVQDSLRRRAKGPNALFERPAYGRYGLRGEGKGS
jgi:hypothetical protein